MAVKQQIEFRIGPSGEVEIEVKGVKGKDCLAITKDLEEALGIVKSRTHTSEYYEQEQQLKISLHNDSEE